MRRHAFWWLVALVVLATAAGVKAVDQDEAEKRVKELLRVIESQELGGQERQDTASAADSSTSCSDRTSRTRSSSTPVA